MSVIYELRGRAAALGELGLNLFSGCAVGCRNCNDPWIRRMTWEKWTTDVRPQKNILSQVKRDAKRMEGDPREIAVCPSGDPYQSDEAAQLTRKALLILEQYHMRVQIATLCGMRSAQDFDILARNRWRYSTMILFQLESLREEWEPGGAPIAERVQRSAKRMRREYLLGLRFHPVAYPAQLIEVVETLRADVDAWKISKPLPGEPLPKAIAGGRPGFVDADTALAYLRRTVEKGLAPPLRRMDEMKIWSPGQKDSENRGEPTNDEG